jgi:uncharacterized protein
MPTHTNVSTEILRQLHRIHRQLTDLHERLQRGPKQIQIRDANVKHQEELLAKVQAEAKAFRVATDEKQLQFKSREQKIKEWKIKLNTATSNREYQALREQIEADEMANSVLADEILEALEKVDAYHAKVEEANNALGKAKEEGQRVHQDVETREPSIRADVDRLEAELHQCEAQLPEDIREIYLRISRQRGEEALAPVIDGADGQFCGGCNQQVPINLFSALMLSHPVFCRSCGRLLYLPESTAGRA